MWPNPQDFWASLIPLYSKTSTQKDMESQVKERKTNCVHINIFSIHETSLSRDATANRTDVIHDCQINIALLWLIWN